MEAHSQGMLPCTTPPPPREPGIRDEAVLPRELYPHDFYHLRAHRQVLLCMVDLERLRLGVSLVSTGSWTSAGPVFFVARPPQSNGKVEALSATFQQQLLRQVEMASLTDAQPVISHWAGPVPHPGAQGTRGYAGARRQVSWPDGEDAAAHRREVRRALLTPEHRGLEVFKGGSRGGNPARSISAAVRYLGKS